MEVAGLVLVGVAIAIGLVGIVVAALPGLVLVWAAVLVWALNDRSPAAWTVLVVATLLAIGGQVVKYLVPGRRLRGAGIPNRSLLAGVALSVVGFFAVPVIGFVLGFVLGVYLAERIRLRSASRAWSSTKMALRAAGLSILIELAAGLVIAAIWLATALLLL